MYILVTPTHGVLIIDRRRVWYWPDKELNNIALITLEMGSQNDCPLVGMSENPKSMFA